MPKGKNGSYNPKAVTGKGLKGSGLTGINNLHPVVNPTKGKGFEGLSGNKPMTRKK